MLRGTRAVVAKLFKQAWASKILRSVGVVVSGTAAAQIITLLFTPLVTRIYGPEIFGLFGVFVAVINLTIPLAALAYPLAVVLPAHNREAIALVRLSVLLSIIISLLFGTFFWMAKDLLVELFDIEPLKDFILFIPFAMLFAVLLQLAMQWLIRMKEFRLIARSAVIHSLILNVAKVGVGLLYPFGVALIAVATMGYALHSALLAGSAIFAFARSHRDESASSPLSPFRAAKKYIDFPLYRAPQSFISDLSQGLPILLLSGLFGPVAAGYYAISKMSMGVPSVLVGKALRDVLYPHLAEAFRNGECLYRPLVRSTTLLAFIGALPFGVVVFYGPLLFSWIFGSEWVAAGEYARWLAIFFYFNLINKPSFAAVPVLGLQKELLLYEIGSIALKALGLFAGFFVFESDLWAVALFSMFGAASYVFMIFWVAFRSKVK